MSGTDRLYLVFDIGGTSIRGAVYDARRDVLTRRLRAPTASNWTEPTLAPDRLLEHLADELWRIGALLLDEPSVVSMGFPGPISPSGALLAAPTVLGRRSATVDLRQMLETAWPAANVLITNDVSTAGYALADGRSDPFCVVTVSSGIGCKVFMDGHPVVGPNGRGGELGHLRVDFDPGANVCECGGRGHLGAVASGRGALQTARRLGFGAGAIEYDSAEALVAGFDAEEPYACEIVAGAASALGLGLAALHTGLGLECFVITGGFALALGERYRALLAKASAKCCWNLGQEWNRMIELDPLNGQGGLLGAGRYASTVLSLGSRA